MTLKADTEISTEDLIGAAKDMVANAATSARAPALALIDQLAGRLDIYHHGVKNLADMLEQHEYAHQFIGSGLIDLVRLDVALAQLTSHDNRAHAGHCILQEAMNEAADLLATASLFNPGEATMVLVNKAISLLRERPSIRDGRQPTLVEQLVQQLEDATRQCALQADLLKEALPDVREGLAGTSAVDLASRIESALAGQLPVLDNTPDCVLSAEQTERLRRSLTNFGIASPESLEELAIRQRHYVLRLINATQQDGTLGAILHQARTHFDQLLESGRCETSAEIDLAVNMIDAIDSHLQGRDPKYAMLVTREQHAELTSLLARTQALLEKEATLSAQAVSLDQKVEQLQQSVDAISQGGAA